MRRSSIIEARRQSVDPEARRMVEFSFQIVDRIHDILEKKEMKQKDLAMLLGKKETEISKWMRGTRNFAFDTILMVESALRY